MRSFEHHAKEIFSTEEELSPALQALTISSAKASLLDFDEEDDPLPDEALLSDESVDTVFSGESLLPHVEVGEDADIIFMDAIMESMGMK